MIFEVNLLSIKPELQLQQNSQHRNIQIYLMNSQVLETLQLDQLVNYKQTLKKRIGDLRNFEIELMRQNEQLKKQIQEAAIISTQRYKKEQIQHNKFFNFDNWFEMSKDKVVGLFRTKPNNQIKKQINQEVHDHHHHDHDYDHGNHEHNHGHHEHNHDHGHHDHDHGYHDHDHGNHEHDHGHHHQQHQHEHSHKPCSEDKKIQRNHSRKKIFTKEIVQQGQNCNQRQYIQNPTIKEQCLENKKQDNQPKTEQQVDKQTNQLEEQQRVIQNQEENEQMCESPNVQVQNKVQQAHHAHQHQYITEQNQQILQSSQNNTVEIQKKQENSHSMEQQIKQQQIRQKQQLQKQPQDNSQQATQTQQNIKHKIHEDKKQNQQ